MKLAKKLLYTTATVIATYGQLFAQKDADNTYVTGGTTQDISNLCANCTGQVASMQDGALNCDMIEVDPYGGIGRGFEQTIRAVVWSGLEGYQTTPLGSTATDIAAIWVQAPNGNFAVHELPSANSIPANNGWTAAHADIAVGAYTNTSGNYQYYVVVVYEAGGDLWTEWWDINSVSVGTPTIDPPSPFSVAFPCVHANNLPAAGFNNPTHPRIDLLANAGPYGSNTKTNYDVAHGIAFQETDASSVDKVYYATGGLYGPIFASSTHYVEDGTLPDVSFVNPVYMAPPPGSPGTPPSFPYEEEQALVTYVNDLGDLRLAEIRAISGYGVHAYHTVATGSTYAHPRIASSVHFDYDYNLNSSSDALASITCQEYDAGYSSNWRTTAYTFTDPSGSPTFTPTEVSDIGGGSFFYNDDCMFPTISGVGHIVTNKYAAAGGSPYYDFPTEFYSDYTHHNSTKPNSGTSTDGDFFANAVQATIPYGTVTTLPYEVNFEDLNGDFAYQNASIPNPMFDADVSRNSGYDLFTVYYDGLRILYKTTAGSSYGFKGAETGVINITTGKTISLYPNPATDVLNVSGADGKDYSILDITGKQVAGGTFAGAKADVNISSLAAGSYIMHINTTDGAEDLKFVKQ